MEEQVEVQQFVQEQQKYAAFDAQGIICAYYDSVDSPVPNDVSNVLPITHSEWMTCITRQGCMVIDGKLVVPADPTEAELLADARRQRVAVMASACQAVIVSGFASSALGDLHVYPSQDTDQRNLQSAALAAMVSPSDWMIPVWCSDGRGKWDLVPHTSAQVQAVNADWVSLRVAAQQKYSQRITLINAAASIAEVEGIAW